MIFRFLFYTVIVYFIFRAVRRLWDAVRLDAAPRNRSPKTKSVQKSKPPVRNNIEDAIWVDL